ncbi:MAG: hypothetical protein QOI63_517, partial [Thermoplasmata archaeon]|nr:hypothetical protein [Thermoplasmata archaeon]
SLARAFLYTAGATTATQTSTATQTGTGGTGTPTSAALPEVPPTGPVLPTEAQVIAANKAIKVGVARAGDDNLVRFTLPAQDGIAPPAGVQVFRSNSPFVLLATLDRSSLEFETGQFRDVGASAGSHYLVTAYYAGGLGKASTSPDQVPGFSQLGDGAARPGQGWGLLETLGVAVAVAAAAAVLLLVRQRRRAREQQEALDGTGPEWGNGSAEHPPR